MRKTLLAFACGSVLAAAAAAQTPPPPRPMGPPPGMNPMSADANHDGVVTREEYLAEAAGRFAQMDTDHDGHVTAGEREAYRAALRDRRIADGATPPPPAPPPPAGDRPEGRGAGGPGGGRDMTREDYMARAAERFDRMDANHDGRLDATEVANMREMRREHRRGGDTPPPPAAQ